MDSHLENVLSSMCMKSERGFSERKNKTGKCKDFWKYL